jgi:hypothetical protein
MYGLKPTDIEAIKPLKGGEMIQICIGAYDIQFAFFPRGHVCVEGRCEVLNSSGEAIDVWDRGNRSEVFRFTELLKKSVTDVAIESEKSFLLTFEDRMALRVIDSSEQYESFSVGNLFV